MDYLDMQAGLERLVDRLADRAGDVVAVAHNGDGGLRAGVAQGVHRLEAGTHAHSHEHGVRGDLLGLAGLHIADEDRAVLDLGQFRAVAHGAGC